MVPLASGQERPDAAGGLLLEVAVGEAELGIRVLVYVTVDASRVEVSVIVAVDAGCVYSRISSVG